MKRMLVLCIGIILTLISCMGFAKETKSLQQLEQIEKWNEVEQVLNKLDASLDAHIKQRALDCEKAVGYEPFCGCILEPLPVAWTFEDYVAITTKSKEQNQYNKMDKDYQKAYDSVGQIRDSCVAKINKKP